MGTIEIISASAGSGKTHRLAALLQEEIRQKRVRPEAVVATTFTVRAAAELQERVRRYLLDADLVDPAQRILAARFGTVNSVCGRLLAEFAFDLGLSPAMKVVDEVRGKHLLRQALDGALTEEQELLVTELTQRWQLLEPPAENPQSRQGRSESDSFSGAVREVVALARSNRIKPATLLYFARPSFESFARFLPKPTKAHQTLEKELLSRLEAFVRAVRAAPKATKKAQNAANDADHVARNLAQKQDVQWNDWVKLETGDAGKEMAGLFDPIAALAREHLGLPKFRNDIERILTLFFDLASQGLERYQALKKQRGLIDFADQEAYALLLLEKPEIQQRLKDQIDLVVVDEFQDTSPMQLAIFLRLAQIAKRSVWVGDQKQAIYGFRGTDPSLMDAAMKAIVGDREPATLGLSYRSRPELVRLTSAVFAPAFGGQDIPRSRVALEPCTDQEPPGLGPIVERWVTGGNKQVQADCIAAGVRGLMDDDQTLVRDLVTKEARRARAGDLAVLCRSNDECQEVAAALDAVGLRVARARTGLFETHEGSLVLAGLRLWLDPKDRLAQAKVQRLLDHAGQPDRWLAGVLGCEGERAQIECAALDRLQQASDQAPVAGPLAAFELVCEALGVREVCLAWGDSEARLANLEALRELAVQYSADGAVTLGGASPGGLIAFLELAAEAGGAQKPAVVDQNAVVVSTWHSAKGLEWPLVVLHGIAAGRKVDPYKARVVPGAGSIDLNDPLAGRWIRYWPFPYHQARRSGALIERIEADEEMRLAREREEREGLRLLYVIWTRARDRLILACKDGELTEGVLGLLNRPEEVIGEPAPSGCRWAGHQVDLVVKLLSPLERKEQKPSAGSGYPPAEPIGHPPAFSSPSDLHPGGGKGRAKKPIQLGKRIAARSTKDPIDPTDLGHAVHGFFAADDPSMARSARRRMAEGLLDRWNAAGALQTDDLVRAADAFWAWVAGTFPGARLHREMPLEHRLASGTVVRGSCDLALETADGWVVINHKTFPGGEAAALERAGQYAPQLAAYAAAIEAATKKKVLGCWVHLPVSGTAIEVGLF